MATDTQDRCRGLMVGLGVGNFLGVPQEGWPRYAVEASYPNGIRDIEVEPGEPDDDDLAQAIILAEAPVDAGSADLDVEEIGRRFWRWAEENGRGIGIQTAAPLAIRWMWNDLVLARNTALSAVATHADPRCIWSAVLTNVAVAMLLRGEDVAAGVVVDLDPPDGRGDWEFSEPVRHRRRRAGNGRGRLFDSERVCSCWPCAGRP